MDRKTLSYWAATALFCAVLAFSGFSHFTHQPMMVEAMQGLGYPLYFMTIIGLAKLAGTVVLLVPGQPLLKEWAYAGLAFNLIGATASHAFAGDAFSHTVRPAAVLLVGVASYLLRPGARRLRLAAAPTVAGTAAEA
jgi:hypothetical protein